MPPRSYMHINSTAQYVCTLSAVKRDRVFFLCYVALRFRTSGPEHFQVPHGDVSVPERRTSANDLAGIPSGGGGELPEQGKHTCS